MTTLRQIRSDLGEVLDQVSVPVDAGLPKESPAHKPLRVDKVNHRVRVVLEGRRENYDLKPPGDGAEEAVNVGSLLDKEPAPRRRVGRRDMDLVVMAEQALGAAVYQCLIKIKHQCHLARYDALVHAKARAAGGHGDERIGVSAHPSVDDVPDMVPQAPQESQNLPHVQHHPCENSPASCSPPRPPFVSFSSLLLPSLRFPPTAILAQRHAPPWASKNFDPCTV
eukprot:CAMPEP_0173430394 /NCGR_PEP_ID=MMETSP1357-20121228/8833_1 /TAXON_ID=77926 /ORGANISM="Hemiselmis rufescens, Strain PCC563" /LENGTH=223 /DNA_ID=CAMNT_0014394721 /DNA_START=693 /DNA_END=1360 /DNA_ORIENTATION=-